MISDSPLMIIPVTGFPLVSFSDVWPANASNCYSGRTVVEEGEVEKEKGVEEEKGFETAR